VGSVGSVGSSVGVGSGVVSVGSVGSVGSSVGVGSDGSVGSVGSVGSLIGVSSELAHLVLLVQGWWW